MKVNRFLGFTALLFAGLLLLPPLGLGCMEVTSEFGMGNLAFTRRYDAERRIHRGRAFPWGVSVYGQEDLSDTISIEGGFYQDPVLRNRSIARLTYDDVYFSITGGPFFGTLNSRSTYLKPGLSSAVTLRWPGLFFFTMRADSSIGVRMVERGDYLQELSELSFGYYIPNAVCRLYFQSKKYVNNKSSGEDVISSENYMFETDIHKKNVPFRIILATGYKQLNKVFIEEDDTKTTYTIGSVMFNSDFYFSFTEAFSAFVKVDNSVYAFPLNDLDDIDVGGPSHMLQASVGITINTDALSRD